MKVVKNHGLKEDFDEEKLYDSAYYPAKEDELSDVEANKLAEKVVYEVKAWIAESEDEIHSSEEIRQKVIDILERENDDVAFLYKTHLDLS